MTTMIDVLAWVLLALVWIAWLAASVVAWWRGW
jgi:hypothetical protein